MGVNLRFLNFPLQFADSERVLIGAAERKGVALLLHHAIQYLFSAGRGGNLEGYLAGGKQTTQALRGQED